MALGGDGAGAGGAGTGAGPEAEDWSFLDLVLLFLLSLLGDVVREVLVAEGDDVRADFFVGGPELWLAVCPRATRPGGVSSTAPVAEDCLCEEGVRSAPRLLPLSAAALVCGREVELSVRPRSLRICSVFSTGRAVFCGWEVELSVRRRSIRIGSFFSVGRGGEISTTEGLLSRAVLVWEDVLLDNLLDEGAGVVDGPSV